MQGSYIPNWHHEIIAKKLEEVEEGVTTRLMLFMPPRHGKSELATKKFPAWYLGRNPDREIMCCSYSADLAEEFGRSTRDIVDDKLHQAVFPDCLLRKGSKSATRWRVGKERGGFLATGVGGSITGMGANILIIDDPVKNREEANSEIFRRKVWEWYTSTAFTRLEKGGAVILIQTRWHDSDLAGQILERDGEKGYNRDPESGLWKEGDSEINQKGKWEVVRFPALAVEDEKYRKKGEALWIDKYDKDDLKEIKSTVGVMDFSALYQQNPIDAEAQLFKNEWFKSWKTLPKPIRYYTSVDPAISKKKDADESVVLTVGRDLHHNLYVVEIRHGKWNPSELIIEIYKQHEKWNSRVGIETTQYQQSIVHYMKLEQQKRGKYLNVHQIRHSTQKELRIRGLEPFYRNGMISHPPGGADALEEQLKRFPASKHDDIMDALATAVFMSEKPFGRADHHNIMVKTGIKYTKDGRPFI